MSEYRVDTMIGGVLESDVTLESQKHSKACDDTLMIAAEKLASNKPVKQKALVFMDKEVGILYYENQGGLLMGLLYVAMFGSSPIEGVAYTLEGGGRRLDLQEHEKSDDPPLYERGIIQLYFNESGGYMRKQEGDEASSWSRVILTGGMPVDPWEKKRE